MVASGRAAVAYPLQARLSDGERNSNDNRSRAVAQERFVTSEVPARVDDDLAYSFSRVRTACQNKRKTMSFVRIQAEIVCFCSR